MKGATVWGLSQTASAEPTIDIRDSLCTSFRNQEGKEWEHFVPVPLFLTSIIILKRSVIASSKEESRRASRKDGPDCILLLESRKLPWQVFPLKEG